MSIRSVVLPVFAACALLSTVGLTAGRHGHGQFKAACGSDVEKLCSGTEHGKATFECLRSHQSDLSDTCKAFLDKHQAHEQEEEKPAPQQ